MEKQNICANSGSTALSVQLELSEKKVIKYT